MNFKDKIFFIQIFFVVQENFFEFVGVRFSLSLCVQWSACETSEFCHTRGMRDLSDHQCIARDHSKSIIIIYDLALTRALTFVALQWLRLVHQLNRPRFRCVCTKTPPRVVFFFLHHVHVVLRTFDVMRRIFFWFWFCDIYSIYSCVGWFKKKCQHLLGCIIFIFGAYSAGLCFCAYCMCVPVASVALSIYFQRVNKYILYFSTMF